MVVTTFDNTSFQHYYCADIYNDNVCIL